MATMFETIESPRKSSASACASIVSTRSAPAANSQLLEQRLDLAGSRPGSRAIRRPGSRACWRAPWCGRGAPSAARRPRRRRRCRRPAPRRPAARRCAPGSGADGSLARRTNESTEPPFCAKPMKSSTLAEWPSRCAAIAITAPTVTTPVPPTPVTSRSYGPVQACGAGSGSVSTLACEARRARPGERAGALPQAAADDADEARAEPVGAGVVLVAARLVDLALAAELGLERHDGDAVRLHRAVAAAFADAFVDEEAPRRVDQLALLPAGAASRRRRSARRSAP